MKKAILSVFLGIVLSIGWRQLSAIGVNAPGGCKNLPNCPVTLDSAGELTLPTDASLTVTSGILGVSGSSVTVAGALRVNGAFVVPSGNITASAGSLNIRAANGTDGTTIAVFDEDSGEDAVLVKNPTTAFALPSGNQVFSVAGDARGASIQTAGWVVSGGTLTANNQFIYYSRTRAQINAIAPQVAGASIFCSNCAASGDVCVGTGTAVGQWRRVGTAVGCDE